MAKPVKGWRSYRVTSRQIGVAGALKLVLGLSRGGGGDGDNQLRAVEGAQGFHYDTTQLKQVGAPSKLRTVGGARGGRVPEAEQETGESDADMRVGGRRQQAGMGASERKKTRSWVPLVLLSCYYNSITVLTI
jgi:hypothetical protein